MHQIADWCLQQIPASAISLEEVSPEKVERYGIIKWSEVEKYLYKITELVEKPLMDKASSNPEVLASRFKKRNWWNEKRKNN